MKCSLRRHVACTEPPIPQSDIYVMVVGAIPLFLLHSIANAVLLHQCMTILEAMTSLFYKNTCEILYLEFKILSLEMTPEFH